MAEAKHIDLICQHVVVVVWISGHRVHFRSPASFHIFQLERQRLRCSDGQLNLRFVRPRLQFFYRSNSPARQYIVVRLVLHLSKDVCVVHNLVRFVERRELQPDTVRLVRPRSGHSTRSAAGLLHDLTRVDCDFYILSERGRGARRRERASEGGRSDKS